MRMKEKEKLEKKKVNAFKDGFMILIKMINLYFNK